MNINKIKDEITKYALSGWYSFKEIDKGYCTQQ